MLAIKNNIMAGNAARHLGKAYDSLSTSVERLASGLRINSAKDDAAGLAVRELIRADIAVLQQGSRNASDGISMLQTMEGAMGVIDDNLIRMKELAEQAATGSYSDAQRTIMNAEFGEMADEIDRIAGATKFNDIAMLNTGTGSVSIHVGTTSTIDIDKVNMTKVGLGINTGVSGQSALFGSVAATDAGAYLTVNSEDAMIKITFTHTDTTVGDEDLISVEFTDDLSTYTLDAVVSTINAQTQLLGYADDGTDKNYNMATTVENTDGSYSLKLASRSSANGLTITEGNATAEEDASIEGVFGDVACNTSDTFTAVGTGQYDNTTVAAGVNIATAAAAATALTTITTAINKKDTARASFGYKMNRLESTIAILDIQSENLMSAESRISDVDVATEMATLTRTQVLSQAGISMLAQANQMPQMALSLLR
jgi:flagellin